VTCHECRQKGVVRGSLCEPQKTKEFNMLRRKATVGVALLCALVFCAVSASSASAVAGTTAFTCVKEKTLNGFKDAHCKEKVEVGATGEFGHKEIAENTTTKTHITNEKTDATTTGSTVNLLHAEPFGIKTTVECSKLLGHIDVTNVKDKVTGEHSVTGAKGTLHYTGCKVKEPAGCVIPKETILVEGLTATTSKQAENTIQFKPEVGENFVTFSFEKCNNFLFNGAHSVTGSVRGKINGATVEFSSATTTKEGTLKFFGEPAGLEGKATLSQAEKTTALNDPAATTGNPISATTFNT
jgi:hypothetical protein